MRETDLVDLLKQGAPVAIWVEERFAMRVLQLDNLCEHFVLLDRNREVEKKIAVRDVVHVATQSRGIKLCSDLGIADPHLSEDTCLVLVFGQEPLQLNTVCAFLVDDIEKQSALQKCLEYVVDTMPRQSLTPADGLNGDNAAADNHHTTNGVLDNGVHEQVVTTAAAAAPAAKEDGAPGTPRELKENGTDKDDLDDEDLDNHKQEASCSDRMCENHCVIA
jgi:hypothetical protein